MESTKNSAAITITIEEEISVKQLLKSYDLDSVGIIVVINGELVKNLDTIVKPTDKVLILPAVAGG